MRQTPDSCLWLLWIPFRTSVCSGMGGDADGASSLIVGLPGRSPGESLHAELTSGSLLLSISGPGIEAVSTTARGMRCISQVGGWLGRPTGDNSAQQPRLPTSAALPWAVASAAAHMHHLHLPRFLPPVFLSCPALPCSAS